MDFMVPSYEENVKSVDTPYAFDKKTPNFAQGLDFFRTLDIPRWLYIQFFMLNPNLQSETSENCRKTKL